MMKQLVSIIMPVYNGEKNDREGDTVGIVPNI